MDSYKILYQGVPGGPDTDTLLYTVPKRALTTFTVDGGAVDVTPSAVDENVQTLVTQICLCDGTGAGDTVDIYVVPNSEDSPGAGNLVFNSLVVAANTTERKNLNWPLASDNTIYVNAVTGSVLTITLFGIEVK